jgi:hypothetical protein
MEEDQKVYEVWVTSRDTSATAPPWPRAWRPPSPAVFH